MKVAIVGAGISGITSAFVLKNFDKSIEIDLYEKESFIGGNCYDSFDDSGDYLQQFGPHIFHTSKEYIWKFLNRYSQFTKYKHKVVCSINGALIPFPLQFSYVKEKYGIPSAFFDNEISAENAEEYLYKKLGKEITDTFFKYYSEKQWGIPLNELPVDVVKRIPIRDTDNQYYFDDVYQGIPTNGYTSLFNAILADLNLNRIRKEVSYTDIHESYDLIINTGEVDSFFDYTFGNLKYRSVEFQNYKKEELQSNSVVNYPNSEKFTRITDYNYFLPSNWKCKEFPTNDSLQSRKCYPIFWDSTSIDNLDSYKQYAKENNVILLGRLGSFKYLNIDAAIDLVFNTLIEFDSTQLKENILRW